MMEKRSQEEIEEWAKKLVLSHGGSISGKTIRGTVRHYLQWKENGRYRSKYLRATEVAAVRRQLALLRGKSTSEDAPQPLVAKTDAHYETNVCTGGPLLEFAMEADGLLARDDFPRSTCSRQWKSGRLTGHRRAATHSCSPVFATLRPRRLSSRWGATAVLGDLRDRRQGRWSNASSTM